MFNSFIFYYIQIKASMITHVLASFLNNEMNYINSVLKAARITCLSVIM